MGISKDRISSPLEAGASILDSEKLPPQLLEALDYVSGRLIRKQLHLTLIVVRKGGQPLDETSTTLPPPTPSSAISISFFSRARTPSLPGSPRSTSSTSSSSSTSPTFQFKVSPSPLAISDTHNPASLTLLHTSTLSPKASRNLQESISKASKKYSLRPDWLATSSSPLPDNASCVSPLSSITPCTPAGAPSDLVRRSLQQNDLLFSNEGLTLLNLDRVYNFKLALSTCSRALTACIKANLTVGSMSSSSTAPSTSDLTPFQRAEQAHQLKKALNEKKETALTSAVDALRLLILGQNGRRISKSYLLRSYDHLPVSTPSIHAVNIAYHSHFPGSFPITGLEVTPRRSISPGFKVEVETQPGVVNPCIRTSAGIIRLDRGPHMRGPVTPSGFDDVTPVTRGEWGFFLGAKNCPTAAVEIC